MQRLHHKTYECDLIQEKCKLSHVILYYTIKFPNGEHTPTISATAGFNQTLPPPPHTHTS